MGLIFNGIFIIEFLIKVIALGFIMHKNSYLRQGWNVLDFIVVLTSIAEYIFYGDTTFKPMQAIRSLRAFRPFRSIQSFPSMRRLVRILLTSLPNLANVIVLLTFIIVLFSILGLHEFSGPEYSRCRLTPQPEEPEFWPLLEGYTFLCKQGDNSTCPGETYCGNPLEYGIELSDDNVTTTRFISYGIVSFNNIGSSILMVY